MEIENIVLIIGILSPFASAIVTLLGLAYSHRIEKRRADTEHKRVENESVTAEAEAMRIKAETERLSIENALAQVNYYSGIVEDLRKEVAILNAKDKENSEKIFNLENKLRDAEQGKDVLTKENAQLRNQVNAQEKEIQDLRRKIEILEEKNKEQK